MKEDHVVYSPEGKPLGYFTRIAGLYVCLTCGHLCDCGEE